jgi:hypothetical protein
MRKLKQQRSCDTQQLTRANDKMGQLRREYDELQEKSRTTAEQLEAVQAELVKVCLPHPPYLGLAMRAEYAVSCSL